MENHIREAIFKTLSYFQVFNYFLTKDELYKFLHADNPISKKELTSWLKKENLLTKKYVLFLSEKNQKTIKRKKQRLRKIKIQEKKYIFSQKKFQIAKKIAGFLKIIPSIKLIAVSGNLAMMNAKENDDIDFFIITSKNTAWITRLIASLLLIILRKRRMFEEKNVKDKICLNFILDEKNLNLRKKNLYSAHEIAQMKVLFDRNQTYFSFLKENSWIRNHLANFWKINEKYLQETLFNNEETKLEKICNKIFRIFEPISLFFQLQYMKSKITTEKIEKGIMMFHPKDYEKEIMKKYKKILRRHKHFCL